MKSHLRKSILLFFLVFLVTAAGWSLAWAEEYQAMKGVDSVKVMFDMRDENPQSAAIHLGLIRETYKELLAMKKDPAVVVVFMGGAVKLISSKLEGFSAEEQKVLTEITDLVSKMEQDGLRLEVCLFAAKVLGVDPATIHPQVQRVGNGWISEIGYQAQGYTLVPVY
jgi:intracellular sulfur oxidation DsrE/DsrF family protein